VKKPVKKDGGSQINVNKINNKLPEYIEQIAHLDAEIGNEDMMSLNASVNSDKYKAKLHFV